MSTAKSLVLLATSLLASCASTDGPKTPAESGGGSPGALAPALISNEFITLGVLPHAGAHIVELKYKDGPNMLLSDESFWTKAPPAPSAEKPEFLNLNGHIMARPPEGLVDAAEPESGQARQQVAMAARPLPHAGEIRDSIA